MPASWRGACGLWPAAHRARGWESLQSTFARSVTVKQPVWPQDAVMLNEPGRRLGALDREGGGGARPWSWGPVSKARSLTPAFARSCGATSGCDFRGELAALRRHRLAGAGRTSHREPSPELAALTSKSWGA